MQTNGVLQIAKCPQSPPPSRTEGILSLVSRDGTIQERSTLIVSAFVLSCTENRQCSNLSPASTQLRRCARSENAVKSQHQQDRVQPGNGFLMNGLPPHFELDALLRTSEVAAMLAVSQPTLCRWRLQGTGPRWADLNGLPRYRRDDVEAWVKEKVT